MGDLTKNFSRSEFACHCGCGEDRISLVLVDILQKVRNVLGRPIQINSGVRCAFHNKGEGGSEDSEHVPGGGTTGVGEGVDIKCTTSNDRYLLLSALLLIGVQRIGVDGEFVHCGIRAVKDKEVFWLYP